jgi:hypothetical protein
VNLDEFILRIVARLPEPHGFVGRVFFLEGASLPVHFSRNFQKVQPAAVWLLAAATVAAPLVLAFAPTWTRLGL